MVTKYSIEQMNRLKDELNNVGYSSEDVDNLRPYLPAILEVLNGRAKIVADPTHLLQIFPEHESRIVSSGSSEIISYKDARRILGVDLLGIECLKMVYGIEFSEKDLPPIACSEKILIRFKKRFDCQLILEIREIGQGLPSSIRHMNIFAKGKTQDGGKFLSLGDGVEITNGSWCKKEPFLDSFLEFGWRISSKKSIDGTLDRIYPAQTSFLINALEYVYDGEIPSRYLVPIMIFQKNKRHVFDLIRDRELKPAGDFIEACGIDSLLRESITSFVYRTYLTKMTTGEKLFSRSCIRTSTRASDGMFVSAGFYNRDGVYLDKNMPDSVPNLSASLSFRL